MGVSLATFTMIASPEAAKEFLDKLNEKKNENASINLEVVKNLFEEELGKTLTEDQINDIFKDGLDDDGNGFLHYPHFMIVYAFVMSDANENGLLNVSDLKTLAETFYSDLMTDQDVEEKWQIMMWMVINSSITMNGVNFAKNV